MKKPKDETRCKEDVRVAGLRWPTYNQCRFKVWKDDYCKMHHPESVEERRKKSDELYKKKQENSIYGVLKRERERAGKLETENAELRAIVRKYLKSAENPLGMSDLADIDAEARAILEKTK